MLRLHCKSANCKKIACTVTVLCCNCPWATNAKFWKWKVLKVIAGSVLRCGHTPQQHADVLVCEAFLPLWPCRVDLQVSWLQENGIHHHCALQMQLAISNKWKAINSTIAACMLTMCSIIIALCAIKGDWCWCNPAGASAYYMTTCCFTCVRGCLWCTCLFPACRPRLRDSTLIV